MNANLYLRPNLTASQNKITDPDLLVDLWVDQFLAQHDTSAADSPDGAYDFLVLWGRLQRTRLDLLDATQRLEELEPVQRIVQEQARDLLRRALTLPNPDAWLVEARLFEEAFDSVIDHAELAIWAELLLMDLDDASLIAWAARRFGMADAELETQLTACEFWLEQHADLYLACGVYVQAVGQTLRPDLAEQDWELACTADKFVILLDEQEAAQVRLTGTSTLTVDPGILTELFRRSLPVPALIVADDDFARDWSWLPEPKLLAASAASAAPMQHRDWVSPDGLHHATLAAGPDSTVIVRINFYRASESALDLAGHTAFLAGIRAVIDTGGNADFDVGLLHRARLEGSPLTLQLDNSESAWRRVSQEH